jgi:hypothetical protein
MINAEISKEITVEALVTLNESIGLTVELNDGAIVSAQIEEG